VLKLGTNNDPGEVLNLNGGEREVNNDNHAAQSSHFETLSLVYVTDGHDNDLDMVVDEADEEVFLQTLLPANGPLPFAIQTDDPKWLDPGPGGLQPPDSAYVINHFNNTYNPAYIWCEEIPAELNTHKAPDFVRNTDQQLGQVDVPGDEQYWTACITWGYEHLLTKYPILPQQGCEQKVLYQGDDDPEMEGLPLSAERIHGQDGETPIDGDRSMVWCETGRDGEDLNVAAVSFYLAHVAAHEMGHIFGLIDNVIVVAGEGSMSEEEYLALDEETSIYDLPIYRPDDDGLMAYKYAQVPWGWSLCPERWRLTGATYQVKYTLGPREIRNLRWMAQDRVENP
jgi:hypothetical protein